MLAYRAANSLFKDEIRPYLRSSSKKSYLVQLKELIRLYRAYRHVPYQYMKTGLYSKFADLPVETYIPPRLIYGYGNAVNRPEDVKLAKDKAAFGRAMSQKSIPVAAELFHVDRDGAVHDGASTRIDAAGARAILERHGADVFVKPIDGTWGRGAFILDAETARAELPGGHRNVIVQPVLRQHPVLRALYPSAINTVRIDTLRTEEGVLNNAAVLRIGLGGAVVDNGSAGGLIAGIDLETGRVRPRARQVPKFGDEWHDRHPDTGVAFGEVTVPFWTDILRLVGRASDALPLGSAGWDVAVTPDGPVLIEVNHQWDVNVMQIGWGGLGPTELGRRALEHHRRRATG
jgi:hypothetical protein